MMRWLVRLYPAWFRDRYGGEVVELLARSSHRTRDAANVAMHAARLRTENLMERPLLRLADGFVVASAFSLGYVVNDLQTGVTEVPHHWWSSLAVLIAVISIAARAALASVYTRKPPAHQPARDPSAGHPD